MASVKIVSGKSSIEYTTKNNTISKADALRLAAYVVMLETKRTGVPYVRQKT